MSSKRSLDEPAVRDLLTGLIRSGMRYYRIIPETGSHMPVVARVELMKLHMSEATGSRLLREAVSAGLITEEKIDHGTSESQVGTCDTRAAEKEAAVVANATDEDIEDDGDEEPGESTSRYHRSPMGLGDMKPGQIHWYQLVKQGDWYGYWDDEYGYQELVSKEKAETLELIYQLQRHGSHDPFQWRTN